MTNRELGIEIGKLIREERRITNEILKLINLASERRAYVEHGFASLFDWLVHGFGYSHSAAYRRIEAARLLKSMPEVAGKLESGEVNLSTLSKTQSAIRAHERSSGQKLSREIKENILDQIENKSVLEAERVLCSILPDYKRFAQQDHRVVIDETTTRYSMNFSEETSADLRRAKEVLSHKLPGASDSEVLAYALKFLLEKLDPLKQRAAAAASKRVTKVGGRRMVLNSTEGRCSFKDPLSGKTCGSSYQVELDHIIPKALGGSDDPENLRPLCRPHNVHMAEQVFGKAHMDQFRKL